MPDLDRKPSNYFPAIALIAAVFASIFWTNGASAQSSSRIKDIVFVENVRPNQLIGYGLVVGLKGTGDKLRNSPFTQQSLQGMLERLGITTRDITMKTANVAAVSVVAQLPPFSRKGSKIDVQISAMGDASDLMGGTLLVTPLVGLDGEVYAVAQGNVTVSGFSAKGKAAQVSRGVTTSARITGGAIVEREVGFNFNSMEQVKLALRNPDFTTAQQVAMTINRANGPIAEAIDPATVVVRKPDGEQLTMMALVSRIEQLPVLVDQPARIIIDEASGTVVMGADVRISRVAIAQGNLTIKISESPQVAQPNPLAQGDTVVVPRTEIEIDDSSESRLAVLQGGVSLQSLVNGLNALGVGPRDLISILQSLRAAGALQADIEVL